MTTRETASHCRAPDWRARAAQELSRPPCRYVQGSCCVLLTPLAAGSSLVWCCVQEYQRTFLSIRTRCLLTISARAGTAVLRPPQPAIGRWDMAAAYCVILSLRLSPPRTADEDVSGYWNKYECALGWRRIVWASLSKHLFPAATVPAILSARLRTKQIPIPRPRLRSPTAISHATTCAFGKPGRPIESV